MNAWFGIAALALVAGAGFLPAAEVSCASAESMDGLMRAWTAGYTASHPQAPARVTLRARYSADFVEPLARGEVQVATFARELFPAESARFAALAGAAPLLVPVATGSRATKGGTHAIVIFVHEKNPLTQISLSQLREVFARDGRITTWGQLGLTGEWAGRKISRHGMRSRRETGNPPGIVNFLESRLLAGRAWREDIHESTDVPDGAQSLDQIVRAVAADESALGYSGFAYAVPGVKALALGETDAGPFYAGTEEEIARGDYPLVRTIYLGIGPAPDAATRNFLNYVLSPAGQRVISADAHKFYPVNPMALAQAQRSVAPAIPAYVPQVVEFPRDASYVTASGAIAIVGYNDMQGILENLGARFSALHPGFNFSLSLKGTKTAPPALARGESAFAPMGAEFTPDQMADYLDQVDRQPRAFRIAHASLSDRALSGPVAIIVHKDNPLTALTLAQVAGIFSGRATLGLHPGGLRPELALGIFLREKLALGDAFGGGFRGFRQSAEVVGWIASDPLAIGFAAVNRITSGVKVLALASDEATPPVALTDETIRAGRYPLDRFLLIYVREPVAPWLREYLAFVLSPEGQAIISRDPLGYLPLNEAELNVERAKLNELQ